MCKKCDKVAIIKGILLIANSAIDAGESDIATNLMMIVAREFPSIAGLADAAEVAEVVTYILSKLVPQDIN